MEAERGCKASMTRSNDLLCRWARFVHNNAVCVLASLTCGLLLLCLVAIRSEKLDTDLMSWVQRSSRIEAELDHVMKSMKEGTGSTGQLLLQMPHEPETDVLSVDALMVHLEAMAIATHVTVDLYDVSWSLKDLCFTPTLPDFDGPNVNLMMDSIMPCAIKTPLDCFWEGAKILGPEQPIRMSSIGPALKWTSINPIQMVELERANHPHASVPYQSLIDWMRRVGITTGYQFKPCLDPSDPNCPSTAPNKASGQAPDIASTLMGGCHGLAANQMHWHEDEIVGGLVKNDTGYIISARGLQSTIQLMGEKDMYELWRKTNKVQDINNWSVGKAKSVLDQWQQRFRQELSHFTRTSKLASSSYKIHAMTSDSMLEPIDAKSLRDPTNFLICFTLMTIMSCLIYPPINKKTDKNDNNKSTTKNNGDTKVCSDSSDSSDDDDGDDETGTSSKQRKAYRLAASLTRKTMKHVTMAIVSSIYIGLIFIASLGVSLLMDLPINVATTQILPPIALYYGFNLFNTIVHIYSQKFGQVSWTSLTRECLYESLPLVAIQTVSYIIAFTVATTIPVPATRVLAFQAIIFTLLMSMAAVLILPPIMILLLRAGQLERPRLVSKVFTVTTEDLNSSGTRISIEDQIFSRIHDDLKNIRADSRQAPDNNNNNINFSAQLEVNGLRTSFRLSAPIAARRTEQHQAEPKKQTATHQAESPPAAPPPKASYIKWDYSGPFISSTPPALPCESKEVYFRQEPKLELCPTKLLTTNRPIQATVIVVFAVIFAAMISFIPKIRYGLSIKDIIVHGSPEYESWSMQEEYFPVYNIFAVTKGNFDYPNNQKLLHDYYRSIEQVDGVLKGSGDRTARSKFWLAAFRDWLIELQEKFDIDRNRSAISSEGWEPHADDASKLAYKLLAQTGRVDNPVDKSQVETNRLVDSNQIINPKAFYYYLSAWVAYDPFSYATTEANFEPEPKAVPGNPNDLKMDKARPLMSAHIPFVVKLPSCNENLKTLLEIRRISQSFEQLNLPNFPTGIPFIFWDQFISIELLMFISLLIGTLAMLLVINMITSNCKLTAIVTLPAALTVLELYGYMSFAQIPFNNVFAFLLLATLGISTMQSIHYVTYFGNKRDTMETRTQKAMKNRSRVAITNLLLFLVSNSVFYGAKMDFMIKCSSLLLCLATLNLLKSLLLTPVLLSLFGSSFALSSKHHNNDNYKDDRLSSEKSSSSSSNKRKTHGSSSSSKNSSSKGNKRKQQVVKTKRNYPRVQSEISLSTISEEPQSESHVHDVMVDLSIKCY